MDLDSLGKLKKEELKSLCKEKGLPVSGNKSDLVDRLSNRNSTGNQSVGTSTQPKRPDLVIKGKQKKGTVEKIIKKSLFGTLRKKQLYPIISKWVSNASKTMNRGSLLFNRFLIHCLSNNIELPDFSLNPSEDSSTQNFFNHCFKTGKTGIKKSKSNFDIQTVWNQYFQSFPPLTTETGDSRTITWIAKNYSTVFNNSLEFNFESRQKRYIRHWLEQNNLNKDWIHSIRCAVNGWNCRTEPPLEAREFILSQRQLLIPPEDGISDEWLKGNRNTILRYFWVILKYLETIDTAKKFSLAPIHTISSHFLMIDTTVLYYMSRDAGIIPENLKYEEFNTKKDKYFRDIFKFKESERYRFSEKIQTDGVSVCFHYRIPNPKKEETDIEKAEYERMIGIDPGRSNLIFGVEKTPKGLQTYRLTRNQYYCASGMTKRKQRASKWQQEIQEEEQVFSRVSPKTTNPVQWDSFLRDYISVYDRLWEVKTGKKWARARFRVFGLKKKALDRFFNRMEGSVKPLICFGSSKFKSNGKGELSAPTTSIFKACERRFKVELIYEFRTTKVCVNCDCVLQPVRIYSKKLGKYKEIRGLRRCSSSVCSQTSYKNRDLNAALNILRCHSSFPRPKILSREFSGGEKLRPKKSWCLKYAR
jgi:hypothetical protein